jgi:bifunctional enzyme CysN/CysC
VAVVSETNKNDHGHMVDAGLIVLVSFISPFRAERRMARELVEKQEFIEVYVKTPWRSRRAAIPKAFTAKLVVAS